MYSAESLKDSMTMYYAGVPIEDIAQSARCKIGAMQKRITVERKRLGLIKRKKVSRRLSTEVLEFINDKEIVIELYQDSILPVDIADKWGTTTATVIKYLNKWGFITDQKITNIISLSELYKQWAHTVKGEEMILTVNKRPMFKLMRIL